MPKNRPYNLADLPNEESWKDIEKQLSDFRDYAYDFSMLKRSYPDDADPSVRIKKYESDHPSSQKSNFAMKQNFMRTYSQLQKMPELEGVMKEWMGAYDLYQTGEQVKAKKIMGFSAEKAQDILVRNYLKNQDITDKLIGNFTKPESIIK